MVVIYIILELIFEMVINKLDSEVPQVTVVFTAILLILY